MNVVDPIKLQKLIWPDVTFYREQREILYSVQENPETFVPAGNMLGKDFVSAFIALWFFLSRHPCRVVTTSVDHTQLEGVLWGEIRRFIQTAKHKLPLVVNHLHLRKEINGEVDGLSYLIGRVSAKGEGMLGHHIAQTGDGVPRTLFIADEASGVDSISYERADTWANRKLVIGNPYPCSNFFYSGVKGGNVPSPTDPEKLYRKIIKIRGQDSPNVRCALAEIKAGKKPSHRMLVPGVLSYTSYAERRELWDDIRQTIGLDAEFYEGSEVLLYPPDWLNQAARVAADLESVPRKAKAIGCDPAEGGDSSTWAVVDDLGLIEMVSLKTPDTTFIPNETIRLMKHYNVPAECVYFDRGGGGKQHADRLRSMGYEVQTVAFGSAPSEMTEYHRMKTTAERKDESETKYAYKNKRAEMYWLLRRHLDPSEGKVFGLPAKYTELRRQLAPMPLMYDEEGRCVMLPKRDAGKANKDTLEKLIGCSPDEADALVLAVYGAFSGSEATSMGVAF